MERVEGRRAALLEQPVLPAFSMTLLLDQGWMGPALALVCVKYCMDRKCLLQCVWSGVVGLSSDCALFPPDLGERSLSPHDPKHQQRCHDSRMPVTKRSQTS